MPATLRAEYLLRMHGMLATWLPIALATAAAFGFYNFFIKLGSGRIDQVLGAVVLQVVAALLGGGFLLFLKASGQPLPVSRPGLLYASLAGVCVGIAEILTFVAFARGAPASLGAPIIMGGSVVVSAVLGIVLLRERLSAVQACGIALVVLGIGLATVGSRH